MTKAQVEAVVGPPSSEGTRPDGTSWRSISRSSSRDWIDLGFDAEGRLRFFQYDDF